MDDDPAGLSAIGAAVPGGTEILRRTGTGSPAVEALVRGGFRVLIVADRALEEGPWSEVGGRRAFFEKVRGQNIPILAVVDSAADAQRLADAGFDDWVTRRGLREELPLRLARLAEGRAVEQTSFPPLDRDFLGLLVHDLRTPLNVVGLSLRMISRALPKGDADLEEDVRFVDENFRQIERMLAQLTDYIRLFERDGPPPPTLFSPRRLVDEVLEARLAKVTGKASPVVLEVAPSCPSEVALDPARARTAFLYALANTNPASGGGPIHLRMSGGADRWVTEFSVDVPPPESVCSTDLSPTRFERLCGSAAERRGMDLAIAAKVSEQFGGTARLVVETDRNSAVVLDWPARLPEA